MATYVLAPPRAASSPSRPSTYGDRFSRPLYLAPGNGSFTADYRRAGRAPADPDLPRAYQAAHQTVWVEYVPDEASDVTVAKTAGLASHIEVYVGTGLDDLALVASGQDTVTFAASVSTVYRLRVRPVDPNPTATATFSVTATPRIPAVILIAEDVQQLPGSVRVTITNGEPNAAVTLSIDGQAGSNAYVTLDDSGTLIDYAVLFNVTLPAGAYTMRAVHFDRADATDPFNVLLEPDPPQETPPPPAPPTSVPGSLVLIDGRWVRRFVLQDKAPAGRGDYIMPRNPTSMTSPFPDNALTTDVSLAPDGQMLTWEGARRSKSWTWNGYLDTQAQHDEMLAFQKLNRRFYVIDHRNRAWEVSFEAFEPEPVRNVEKPWAHTYKATFLIHDGPQEAT